MENFNWLFTKKVMPNENFVRDSAVLHVRRSSDKRVFEIENHGNNKIEGGTYFWQFDPYYGGQTYDIDPPWNGDYWITIEDYEGKTRLFILTI